MTDASPPIIIETVITERHDVREEVIEHVARLLCRADGKSPDGDIRVQANMVFTVHIPYPMNQPWYAYRDKAIEKLSNLFAPAGKN
jgi:hypothetical protein